MKNPLLIFLLFFSNQIFSQNNKIDKSIIIPREIDFNDCVKKITIKNYILNKKNNKIDTVKTISEINFSKKGNIQLLKSYNNSLNDLWSIVEFDVLGRIKTISKKNNDKMINTVNQYFSNTTEFPDSTLINTSENYKEKYINYFKKNLVIKQEHYVNNSLQDFRVYKYNNQNQLIEDLYLNPENDTDETVVSKSDNQLSFYPERLTLFEYKKIKDTIITIKISPKFSLKEVTKKIKTDKFSLEIIDEYDHDYLAKSRFFYTSKDSISDIRYYYKNKKEIRDYYKTITTPKSIVSIWKSEISYDKAERNETINIDIVYDKFNNWIKKIYSKDNVITQIIEREIGYYCH
jgi:hypothetical protein